MLRRARHRVAQFAGALRPHVSASDRFEAYAWLNDAQRRLFESMTLRDQQHGIDVFDRVRAAAPDDATLLVAALVHDCGKGPDVRTWHRVMYVALETVAPGLVPKLARAEGSGWRHVFWRLLRHPEIGADLVAETGADPDVVRIIREQESARADDRLALLQAADEA